MAKGEGGGYGVTRELTPTSTVFCRARVGQPNLPPSIPVIRPRFACVGYVPVVLFTALLLRARRLQRHRCCTRLHVFQNCFDFDLGRWRALTVHRLLLYTSSTSSLRLGARTGF